MISYHTEGGTHRIYDHYDGQFKAKFPLCMGIILVYHSIHDPHTVSNMIHYCFPFLIGPQSTCNIERDWCFAKKDPAQAIGIWMSQNPAERAFYCDLTGGYTGDDCVINKSIPLFVEYCNLTITDGFMDDNDFVDKIFPTAIPEYFNLTT